MVADGDSTRSNSGASAPPGSVLRGRGRGWYRGDLHVHSRRSQGGELTAEQLVVAAREVGLDFLAITEHDTAEGHGDWAALGGEDLLVILGQEVVTESGHWLALGLDVGQAVDGRIDQCLAQVHRAGGLCVVAHPHVSYASGTFRYPVEGFDLVEVWNGQWASDLAWQADNEAALAEWGRDLAAGVHRGRWRPAIGNSDVHLRGQIGTPQNVVLADGLDTEAVLAAVRSGHCWIAESADVRLDFVARAGDRTAQIGERLETGGEDVAVRVRVSGVPSGRVTFHAEGGAVHHDVLPAEGAGEATWSTDPRRSSFVRVEVRRPGGRVAAVTNPIVLV